MTTGPWRRRFVHDLLFAIEGSGWHEPELRDSIGYRWSGPGRLSVLRVQVPPGAGRAEAHLPLLPGEPVPELAVFLNGHRLEAVPRRLGTCVVLDLAWEAALTAGEPQAEFWFHVARTMQLPAPGQRMRSVGFRLSTLTVEAAAEGRAAAAGEASLALIAGRRFLAEHLPVATGRARLAFRSDGAAPILEMRLEGARLGPSPQPLLDLTLRAVAGELHIALTAPGTPPIEAMLRDGSGLTFPAGHAGRDRLLLARFLAALPGAFARWLDEAMSGAAPDAELLALWRRHLGALARAADSLAATDLADGPAPFAFDPAVPFAWTAGGVSN